MSEQIFPVTKSKGQVVKHLDLETLLEQVEELLKEGEELLPSDYERVRSRTNPEIDPWSLGFTTEKRGTELPNAR